MDIISDIKVLVTKAFGVGIMSRDGINYSVKCPLCQEHRKDKKKLVIRLDDARYHCWVCGAKGSNISRLISKFRPDLVQGVKVKLEKSPEFIEEVEEIYEEVVMEEPQPVEEVAMAKKEPEVVEETVN